MNKVALITGSSRGIGKKISENLAKSGYNIVIAAKTTKKNNIYDETIYDIKKNLEEKYNIKALAVKTDLRKTDDINNLINETYKKFGRLDALINNASALWWKNIIETPEKKYDLINNINSKASFLLSRSAIELMNKNDGGHIIMHSPPLPNPHDNLIYKNKTAYMISKLGMTITALGISEEYKGKNISANTIWPATAIESDATKVMKLGTERDWRKPDIIADCIKYILNEDKNTFTGNQLIDEIYLKSKGVNDLSNYRCIKDHEPEKLINLFNKIY